MVSQSLDGFFSKASKALWKAGLSPFPRGSFYRIISSYMVVMAVVVRLQELNDGQIELSIRC